MTDQAARLSTEHLTLRFGGLTAVEDVTLYVNAHEILSIIGPNGAGKTSLFNAMTGIYEPTSGAVLANGTPIRLAPMSMLKTCLASVMTGILTTALIFINTLWEHSINAHYVFNEPFDWLWIPLGIRDAIADEPVLFSLCLVITSILAFFGLCKIQQEFLFSPAVCSKAGLARTFQNIRLFPSMSVFENVLLGIRTQQQPSLIGALIPFLFERTVTATDTMQTNKLLDFVGLLDKRDLSATSLSYGERRRVEIARALATNPSVLLLDEPAAGLNPTEGRLLSELIESIKARGIAVVLIEHHMKVVMAISDRIIVLQNGKRIAEGSPAAIQQNQAVIDAYLGTTSHTAEPVS